MKANKITVLTALFFFAFPFCVLAQSEDNKQTTVNREFYKYVVDTAVYNGDEFLYAGIHYEYFMVREQLSDTTFVQANIFDIRNASFIFLDTFKVVDSVWYFLKNGIYYTYLNSADHADNKRIIYPIDSITYLEYIPLKTDNSYDELVFREEYFNGKGKEVIRAIYFDPKKGIVKIEINDNTLVLKDVLDRNAQILLNKVFERGRE